MLASSHDDIPEIERDHMSTMLTLKTMAQALPGHVEEIRAVHPIGKHSVCEFVQRRGARSEIAYAALEAL